MISKLADAGIGLDTLQTAFREGDERRITFLLSESVNNKPRVTKNKKCQEGIILAVKAITPNVV